MPEHQQIKYSVGLAYKHTPSGCLSSRGGLVYKEELVWSSVVGPDVVSNSGAGCAASGSAVRSEGDGMDSTGGSSGSGTGCEMGARGSVTGSSVSVSGIIYEQWVL